jgi:hypothetical protein
MICRLSRIMPRAEDEVAQFGLVLLLIHFFALLLVCVLAKDGEDHGATPPFKFFGSSKDGFPIGPWGEIGTIGFNKKERGGCALSLSFYMRHYCGATEAAASMAAAAAA